MIANQYILLSLTVRLSIHINSLSPSNLFLVDLIIFAYTYDRKDFWIIKIILAECTNLIKKQLDKFINGMINEWVDEWMNDWMNEWMSEGMNDEWMK